ncbi:unnamed protein product [Meloidogyne enterolobii]|uniref:Uncharacterized protein n=1 Tax=Meloidogyne enterolobii TaxID=390850 RepID=A0ACB0ZKS5_MELEN
MAVEVKIKVEEENQAFLHRISNFVLGVQLLEVKLELAYRQNYQFYFEEILQAIHFGVVKWMLKILVNLQVYCVSLLVQGLL